MPNYLIVIAMSLSLAGSLLILNREGAETESIQPLVIEEPRGVEVSPLVLTVPLELEPLLLNMEPRNPWYFPRWKIDQARAFLESVQMPAALKTSLIDRLTESPDGQGSVLMAEEADILALPAEARGRIYTYLGYYVKNYEQACARQYPAASVREWFANVDMSESTFSLLESLSYRNGSLICIADLELLLTGIEDDRERFRVYKALHRVKTYTIQLRVAKDIDLYQLASYWGAGLNDKQVIPVLETLKENGGSMDVVHLLPPVPRQLIYHFPKTDSNRWKVQDCHWTSLNFFNAVASNRALKEKSLWELLERDYVPVAPADLRFGDVAVFLVDNGGEVQPVHSAVYMFDDLFFTKNGANLFSPWSYSRLVDLNSFYSYGRPMARKYYRRTAESMERMREDLKRKRMNRVRNDGVSPEQREVTSVSNVRNE